MEEGRREQVILAVQILICAVYVGYHFFQEAKVLKKVLGKVGETQARERARYEKLKYKKKRAALGK